MTFTPKTWQNSPSTSTPLDATGLIDLETRLAAYTDAAVKYLPLSVPGALAVGAGTARFYAPAAMTVLGVSASLGTTPAGAPVIVDVNKNGTTLFTTQANRPTIAVGETYSGEQIPDVTAIAAGDYLTVDRDQVGGATAAQFINASSVAGHGTVGTFTVSKPANSAEGDLLLLAMQGYDDTMTLTPPANFTQIDTDIVYTGNNVFRLYWGRHDGTGTALSYTVGAGGGNPSSSVQVFAYRSIVPAGDPVDVEHAATPAAHTTFATTSQTPTVLNDIYLVFCVMNQNTTWTAPQGFTERTASAGSFRLFDKQLATLAATGAENFTANGARTGTLFGVLLKTAIGATGSDLTVVVRYR